jgi:fumarylacetoacetase
MLLKHAELLSPFRYVLLIQEPTPSAYLVHEGSSDAYDINLTVTIKGKSATPTVVSKSNLKYMYWTFKQMVAHHTVNGCNLRTGDLLGTGTISGPTPDSMGSLLELTSNGKVPLSLDGETRAFLEDGDEVDMRGKFGSIGFGPCSGVILPAV